jgi:hypothetical protein
MSKLVGAWVLASHALAFAPWLLAHVVGDRGYPRRRAAYLEHVKLNGSRCGCEGCRSFRREMGWLP